MLQQIVRLDTMKSEEGIKVFVRIRPPNDKEKQINRFCVDVDVDSNAVLVGHRGDEKRQKFLYDQVAGSDESQEAVFEKVGKPMCESVMEGYNSTIFAYGQTGAGKTYTMQGSEEEGENSPGASNGIIPRVFEYLFQRIQELRTSGAAEISCKCSYLEIYNETVTDLLNDSASTILIRDDPRKGVLIEGATELSVTSAAETYAALNRGSQVCVPVPTFPLVAPGLFLLLLSVLLCQGRQCSPESRYIPLHVLFVRPFIPSL